MIKHSLGVPPPWRSRDGSVPEHQLIISVDQRILGFLELVDRSSDLDPQILGPNSGGDGDRQVYLHALFSVW